MIVYSCLKKKSKLAFHNAMASWRRKGHSTNMLLINSKRQEHVQKETKCFIHCVLKDS